MTWSDPVTATTISPAAVDQPDDAQALAAAVALSHTGYPLRAHRDALQLLARARIRQDRRLIAGAALCLTTTCRMIGDYEAGIRFGREARGLFVELGDLGRAARAGGDLAWLLASIGEQDAVTEALTALDRAEKAADPVEIILALDAIAIALWLLQQLDKALPFAERAVELSRLHHPRLKRPLINLAGVQVDLALQTKLPPDRFDQVLLDAVALTTEGLVLARACQDGWIERVAICNIADYHLQRSDPASARQVLSGFDSAFGESANRCSAHYLHILGRVRIAEGNLADALAPLAACRDLAMKADDLETATPCHRDISDVHARLGDPARALEAYRAYHDLYVRQASHAAQRRARLFAMEWEAERLRATVKAVKKQAQALSETNSVLAQESERLLRASMEDPLTGLQNRRRLDLAFLELLTVDQPYAIAMIDVDCFKRVNDRFSHQVGDAALRAVAGLLRGCAREDDLIVRYGGDEFALLLRGADLRTAAPICQRLVALARAHDWSSLHADLRVTLSIGVAGSHEARSQEATLSLADQRLYNAKRSGRDQVAAL